MMTLQQMADYAQGALRDEVGPEAAEVVMAMHLWLYGRITGRTRAALRELATDDLVRMLFLLAEVALRP